MTSMNIVGDVIVNPTLLGPGEWVIVYVYTTHSSDHGHPEAYTDIPTVCYKLKTATNEIDWSVHFKVLDQSSDHSNQLKYSIPKRNLQRHVRDNPPKGVLH